MGDLVNIQKQDTCEAEILNTFSMLLPQMTELEKEKLLAFGEGMVLMSGILRSEKNAVQEIIIRRLKGLWKGEPYE